MNRHIQRAVAIGAALLCSSAFAGNGLVADIGDRNPTTGNTSAPSNWRFAPGQVFNGVVGALDGVAMLSYTDPEGSWACSGSLLQGGQYVLTAAHCADSYTSMTVEFGYFNGTSQVVRTVAVGDATIHPLWQGFSNSADRGIDVAILKLNAPVNTIQGYALSTTNDVGKQHLMAGYGTSGTGSSNSSPSWADGLYGHYGYNTFDVSSRDFSFWGEPVAGWGHDDAYYVATTYMVDFDNANGSANNNTLGRIAGVTGNHWTSDAGLGANEALIAGGDSGGGDFVWDGTKWVLSGVHSWGWGGNSACGYFALASCDFRAGNSSSYGDLSGSTAVFEHVAWINATIGAVPEPGTYGLLLAGLGVVVGTARRRRST